MVVVPGVKSPTLIMFAFIVCVLDIGVNDWNNVSVWMRPFLYVVLEGFMIVKVRVIWEPMLVVDG